MLVLMFHGLNTISTYGNDGEDKDNKDTNNVMIRNEPMAEFNRF
jgi:hypothetical protein